MTWPHKFREHPLNRRSIDRNLVSKKRFDEIVLGQPVPPSTARPSMSQWTGACYDCASWGRQSGWPCIVAGEQHSRAETARNISAEISLHQGEKCRCTCSDRFLRR